MWLLVVSTSLLAVLLGNAVVRGRSRTLPSHVGREAKALVRAMLTTDPARRPTVGFVRSMA